MTLLSSCAGYSCAPPSATPKRCTWCHKPRTAPHPECLALMRATVNARYARLREQGKCVVCQASSKRYAKCLECRQADKERVSVPAKGHSLPSAASASGVATERREPTKTLPRASQP